jgi:light-regulated signal transduction histidine kinase (bacteriophytochrome)
MLEGRLVLTSIIDITERKKAEETQKLHHKKIENKNKELEQFTYIASHDLRAPLQSITSFIQLLMEEHAKDLDETGNKSLQFIGEAATRMKELINGLLDYGRIGKSSKLKVVDFNNIVNTVCEDLDYIIKYSKAEIKVEQLPVILCYETEIRLLFQNLIANAIKFMKPGVDPSIIISAQKYKSYWKFMVKDNGIGIDPEFKEKIFIIFQRLHRSEEFEGIGIGLAHCRKIVELHNGEIGVDSEPDKGSTFYFTINSNLEFI